MKKTAILVDGGFYRKKALYLWGKKTPVERCKEVIQYCAMHLRDRSKYTINAEGKKKYSKNDLYRIFYYDCPPVSKVLYHPLLKKNIDFAKSETYEWQTTFLKELTCQRKVAMRLGFLGDETAFYGLKGNAIKKLLNNKLLVSELTESDFELNLRQKSVDMKIGIDIASLSYKKQVDQIILISGDSDFVPAAKLARREGIDFIVDSMGSPIMPDLAEHIDGFQSYYKNKKSTKEIT